MNKQTVIFNESARDETLLPVMNNTGSFGSIFVFVVFIVIPELIKYF